MPLFRSSTRPESPSSAVHSSTAACTAESAQRQVLIVHPDVFQHLRIEGEAFTELAQGLLLRHHRLHDLQAGEDAVAVEAYLEKMMVAALLAARRQPLAIMYS